MKNRQNRLNQTESELPSSSSSSTTGIDLMRVDQCQEIGVGVIEAPVPVKRKRGRPPRTHPKTPPPPPPLRKDDKEEDVCFICFDGGDLVLCDRRNCPKAYHPACIKRDEAFFRTTAKWNCGWHICGTCKKASSYMCYTCTFSACKRCIKDADYVILRDNMGLCGTCIKPIMLIENITQGDNESVKVDFDDKLSWEYLFKIYWLCLKEELSLTVEEITKANNPWKVVPNPIAAAAPKVEVVNEQTHDKAYIPDSSASDVLVNGTKRRRTTDAPKIPVNVPNWATNELLEFVSCMKNGDTSQLSQFDLQNLLLDYIRKKNLRDPLQKSQVICDLMLSKLFGRERVGHFEMLKLLESHFLIQEKPKDEKSTNGETTTSHDVSSQIEEDKDKDSLYDPTVRDRRRKMRRKTDSRVQNENVDAYAAIDVHNINLIYLRRKFLVSLLDDIGKVHENVVGTILRIKVSGSDPKLDIHRLVQVLGTCKGTASYQLGAKTTDVMLEILNLDKKEVISIDQLSDQNVTEDECKRLRQSVKCGLNKRLTVGEILKTAATLQAMRINEAMEAEILKLNHLRDRASEKGHRKELRECVEKLDRLKSPEERQRLLQEIPEVHTDPSLDPGNASSEDAGLVTRKQGIPPGNASSEDTGLVTKKQDKRIKAQGKGPLKKTDPPVLRSRSAVKAIKDDSSKDNNNSSDIQEACKDDEENEIWHYLDPTGKTQGPFSMVQLRRWKSSGHFPPYLRIWKAHEKQDESVLLTDALAGRFDKETTAPSSSLPPQETKSSGVDVNCLQKNPTPIDTSVASTVSALRNDHKEKQVVALASCSTVSAQPPQASCSEPMPVVTPDVRETSGTVVKTVENGINGGSVHGPNLNQEFPSPTPKASPEDLEAQAAETIQSLSSCILVKGPSGVTWSNTTTDATTSSVVVNGGQQLPLPHPQVTQQNTAVLPPPPSVKPVDLTATDQAITTQVAHSSWWPAIVADPDECDESVSDLLAEVEAMEQNGLPSSPTSTFHCDDDDDFTKGPEKDFFNPVARMTAGPELLLFAPPPPVPASISHDLTLTTTALRLGSETTVEAASSVERLHKSVLGGGLEPSPRSLSYHDSPRGNTERSPRGSKQKISGGYSREREQRQWWTNNGHNNNNYNNSSSFNNNHNNRQWPPYTQSHGGYDHGSSGSYAAHPPKGLKICKFYESGHCKKGASCSFWHP